MFSCRLALGCASVTCHLNKPLRRKCLICLYLYVCVCIGLVVKLSINGARYCLLGHIFCKKNSFQYLVLCFLYSGSRYFVCPVQEVRLISKLLQLYPNLWHLVIHKPQLMWKNYAFCYHLWFGIAVHLLLEQEQSWSISFILT